ncbi:YHS domain-containing (seleno)protein [Methylobrevis pamukkalensis]|nr:YHS domain-containing (seleno)protein [Methylobrevis pamukkalensis]
MIAWLALATTPAAALNERIVHDTYTGLALYGFDPVAYFTEGGPREGKADYESEHDGVFWRFASRGNAAAFAAAPAVYVPAYGGHSAVAAAAGFPVPGAPEFFAIRDNRLFLFSSAQQRDQWLKDAARLIAEADARWPVIIESLASR